MTLYSFAMAAIGFIVLAPILGCLLAGVDRIITARLQGRVGPPLLQPLYDVRKLLAKQPSDVNGYQGFYVLLALLASILSGIFFFAGANFLLVIFVFAISALLFIIAAYSTRSPYAEIGAEREIIQVVSYEPLMLLFAMTLFIANGSFDTASVFTTDRPLIVTLPLVFVALLFILTIKLRKSPFDLSYSHHAHQELVKGISIEMSGRTLACVEVMHWYENIMFMGWVSLFFIWGSWVSLVVAVVAVVLVYFLEILIDNNFARVKWQSMLKWSWIITFICCTVNITVLYLLL